MIDPDEKYTSDIAGALRIRPPIQHVPPGEGEYDVMCIIIDQRLVPSQLTDPPI